MTETFRLAKGGREYFTLSFSPTLSAGTVEARIRYRTSISDWYPVGQVDGVWKILLRGPDAPTDDGHLVSESGGLEVRVSDTPEVVIRDGARINLY